MGGDHLAVLGLMSSDKRYGTVVGGKKRRGLGGTTHTGSGGQLSIYERLGVFLEARPAKYQFMGQNLLEGNWLQSCCRAIG